MKLYLTRQAKDDLESIADYIHQQNPEAALRVRDAIIDSPAYPRPFSTYRAKAECFGCQENPDPPLSIFRLLQRRRFGRRAEEIVILTIQHPARKRQHSDA